MILTILILVLALIIMVFSLWKNDIVVWVLDTITWLVWTYLAVNYASTSSIVSTNPYIPEAIGLIGAGMVLFCLYEDISTTIAILRNRSHPVSYDEEKERNREHIYNITRRRRY